MKNGMHRFSDLMRSQTNKTRNATEDSDITPAHLRRAGICGESVLKPEAYGWKWKKVIEEEGRGKIESA